MKILFLTTHNLATNPRLVKEIQLAVDNNYRVEVICFIFRNWSFAQNKKMIESFRAKGVRFHCIEAGREGGINWIASVTREKYYRFLSKVFSLKNAALGVAVSRRSSLLLQEIKKIENADWVIGHNPGALYATQWAAETLKARSGFDVEDYHPGEGNDHHLQKITKLLMQQVLPTMNYVSFAAPLIREAVKNDLGKEGNNWITVLNYFPAGEFIEPAHIEGPLKLVWFSQNISAGRGLEYILPILQKFPEEMELHLFGNLDVSFFETHLKTLVNVIVHDPLSQQDLHRSLSQFDVGLALEPNKDLNNDLAISNKLLAYLQAGLFVVASDTNAQKEYLHLLTMNGMTVDIKNKEETELMMEHLLNKKRQFRTNKLLRYKSFKELNWERQSIEIIEKWKKIKWWTLKL